MAWVYLVLASVFEIAGAIFLKNADGFTRLGPTVLTVASMTTSIVFLGFAMRTLSMGSAYAIWTGVGVVGVAFLGIQMFGESSSPVRLVSISLIVAGVVELEVDGIGSGRTSLIETPAPRSSGRGVVFRYAAISRVEMFDPDFARAIRS